MDCVFISAENAALQLTNYAAFLFTIYTYFVLLVLPEMIFIISAFKFHLFAVAICSTVIFLLSVRSLIFLVGNSPLSVIKSISTYYFLALIFILYELHYFVLFVTLIASYLIFIRNSTYEKLQNDQD